MLNTQNHTPAQLGFRMPAEFEQHEATWLSWPHNKETWENIGEIEKAYIEIIEALHTGEKINILVNNKHMQQYVENNLKNKKINLEQINFFVVTTVDAWIRDYGPNFIANKNTKELAFNHWIFNAWGSKYEDLKEDTIVPEKINNFLKMRCFKPNIVLEGGSIDVNGSGICLTTEQCLLNKNRNPGLPKEEIEQYLMDYLGVNDIIWLKSGLKGDDTDGHIDNLARFVNKDCVVCSFAENDDENYDALAENFEILNKYGYKNGNNKQHTKLKIIKLPMPKLEFNSNNVPASYANFYVGNKVVLVPTYNDVCDSMALNILHDLFTDKKVVGINCRELIHGYGAIHCITQQQPLMI